MSAEGGKIEGTPIQTTTTMDAVKSADQIAQDRRPEPPRARRPRRPARAGCSEGSPRRSPRRKMAGGDDASKPRATFMTMTSEVLKVVTDVSAADVAVPAGVQREQVGAGR